MNKFNLGVWQLYFMNQNQDTSSVLQNMSVLERTWHEIREIQTNPENSG